jgi:superfamily II DNA or RNA helicase
MNMMAKEYVREQFAPQEFSVIVLDECHRSGAESYQKIIKYFRPELLLGMPASPERTDSFDVF